MVETQSKITNIVSEYKRLFPDEYKLFVKEMRGKKDVQSNQFSEIKGDMSLERALLEYPETFYTILRIRLTDDDWKYFDTKPGVRWFAKTFPEFAIAQKI